MINRKDLSRCIDILAELNADIQNRKDKELLLELGYIIKQELDTINRTPIRDEVFDINKLLEDNSQLYNENKKLIECAERMRNTVERVIPNIQNKIGEINFKFDTLNNNLTNLKIS